MVGTAAHAALALADCREGDNGNLFSSEGSSRMVYLIEGVLYKVDIIIGSNADDYDTITSLKDIVPSNIAFPDTTLYRIGNDDVIACERIVGQIKYRCFDAYNADECDDMCFTEDEFYEVSPYLNDPSGMNVILSGGVFYIIDAA